LRASSHIGKATLAHQSKRQSNSTRVGYFVPQENTVVIIRIRVIDAKDQNATHEDIYNHFAEERAGGDDNAMDEFYRYGRQPKAVVSQWHTQAVEVMEQI
jgi:hypothetical protein